MSQPYSDCACASTGSTGSICARCEARRNAESKIDREIAAKFDPAATPPIPFPDRPAIPPGASRSQLVRRLRARRKG